MKLLRVFPTLDPSSGGPVIGALTSSPYLLELGIQSTFATLDSPNSSFLSEYQLPVAALGPVIGKYGYHFSLHTRLRQLALDHDCVIVEGLWQYHALATYRALRGTSIPYFVYPHGMLDPWFKHTYPLKHLKKMAYWPFADYRLLRDATAVLFTTDQERVLARESFSMYHANEVVVGYGTSAPPSDVDHQREVFIQHFPHLRDQRILLFLSRIHPKKGVDLLLDAFAAVAAIDPALQLVIAGPDQVGLQTGLQQRAASLGVADRITWPGLLTGALKWGAFRSAELFCLPSHQENFGVAVAEALACGLPVSISEHVNIAADVSSAGAGIVHTDTTDGTTHALRKWLHMPSNIRAEMGTRARQLFAHRFDSASVVRNLIPVITSHNP